MPELVAVDCREVSDAGDGFVAGTLRLAIVTNIPAPYRVPVMNRLARRPGLQLKVFYAAEREPDRQWDLPPFSHEHVFLSGRMRQKSGRFIHDNPEVFDQLRAFSPDVVVTTGYNPTHLYAFAYARMYGRHHVAMTDGTDVSEAGLSPLHKAVRRFVLGRSAAFVAASKGGGRLFEGYRVPRHKIFDSPLCANTDLDWRVPAGTERRFDLMFSGRLVAVKNVGFFLSVAARAAQHLGRRLRALVLGDGPLESDLRAHADRITDLVDVTFTGHVAQGELPARYSSAKLFLFPTRWDPWGVVANEALQAGVPVLVSPHAGVADDLVRDGVNGRVLMLDEAAWSKAVVELLSDQSAWMRMSMAAVKAVAPFNFDSAARGLEEAARYCVAKRVVCVQRRLTHYRVPLFERVRERLAANGIRFELLHGDPTPEEMRKKDEGQVAWASHVPCRYLLNGRLCWQNCTAAAKGAELLILTQENKLLYNYLAISLQRPRRLAFWGHGRNFQDVKPHAWKEWVRRTMSNSADWWFTYTGMSSRAVRGFGFPDSRIVNLENAVDTAELSALCDRVTQADLVDFRNRWKLGAGPLATFVGSLYEEKRIGFLIAAGAKIATKIPDFRLMIVGEGADRELVEKAVEHYSWLRYGGVMRHREKAVGLRAASVLLNPGLVGLGILDAFAAGLPLVTTDCHLHSPEIEYLRNGENGLMTEDSLGAFTTAVIALLEDAHARQRLSRAARLDAAHYTLDNMAERFCAGVLAALERAPK